MNIVKLFRFELAFDREPQGVGFLQGLADVGLWDIVTANLYSLFDTLPVCVLDEVEPVSFWFTEAGLELYGDAINQVIDEISEENWQLLGASMNDNLENAVYKDAFQVAFSREYIFGKHTQYVEVLDIDKFRKG